MLKLLEHREPKVIFNLYPCALAPNNLISAEPQFLTRGEKTFRKSLRDGAIERRATLSGTAERRRLNVELLECGRLNVELLERRRLNV